MSVSAKIVMIGDTGVGKTAICNRFIHGEFTAQMASTVGVDFTRKKVTVDGQTASLVIYDTAGQEVFKSLAPQYYRDADVALVVFSLISEETFAGAANWIKEIEATNPTVSLVLVGNKVDMEDKRTVSFEEATKMAEENDLPYFETSAATGQCIDELYDEVARIFFGNRREGARLTQSQTSSASTSLAEDIEIMHRKMCC